MIEFEEMPLPSAPKVRTRECIMDEINEHKRAIVRLEEELRSTCPSEVPEEPVLAPGTVSLEGVVPFEENVFGLTIETIHKIWAKFESRIEGTYFNIFQPCYDSYKKDRAAGYWGLISEIIAFAFEQLERIPNICIKSFANACSAITPADGISKTHIRKEVLVLVKCNGILSKTGFGVCIDNLADRFVDEIRDSPLRFADPLFVEWKPPPYAPCYEGQRDELKYYRGKNPYDKMLTFFMGRRGQERPTGLGAKITLQLEKHYTVMAPVLANVP